VVVSEEIEGYFSTIVDEIGDLRMDREDVRAGIVEANRAQLDELMGLGRRNVYKAT
jgi:hypothetical protein